MWRNLRLVGNPAHEIGTLAIFALALTTAIFLIVSGLLTYTVIRLRARRGDDGTAPPQTYGSGLLESAWTAVPVLLVFMLILTTASTIYTVQAAQRSPYAVAVRVVRHQLESPAIRSELVIVAAEHGRTRATASTPARRADTLSHPELEKE